MTTLRWQFRDTETDETYTVPLNPKAMTPPPLISKQLTYGSRPNRGPGSLTVPALRTPGAADQWQFSGTLRSQAHHDALADWAARDSIVEVTDHLGRTFAVVFQSFSAADKRSGQIAWRQDYTMKALMLRRVA